MIQITAGAIPPNPAELLGSMKMIQILEYLQSQADIVIVDGPPFIVADAATLSVKVDGVLLVIRANFTRQPAIKAMMDQITRAGARVLGVALNRIPRRNTGYYAGSYYSSYYTGGYEENQEKSRITFPRRKSPSSKHKPKEDFPANTKSTKLAETDAPAVKVNESSIERDCLEYPDGNIRILYYGELPGVTYSTRIVYIYERAGVDLNGDHSLTGG
jgi:Mrp family chromosome partitioning ATPase